MLLSICIPTYNRAEYLRKTLESIISQPAWKDGITEIVISNNASTDHTDSVIKEYSEKFPNLIRSISQPNPINSHLNFEEAMRMGKGTFLKLNNDTLTWQPNMLKTYLELLNSENTDIILTPNSPMAPGFSRNETICKSIDETINFCSYFITWIGCFGVRRETFLKLDNPSRNPETYLTQVDMILRLLNSGYKAKCDGRHFFETLNIANRANYQIVEIFGHNYFIILKEYLNKGLSKNTF